MKRFLAKIVRPFFLRWKRKHPEELDLAVKDAGNLDLSGMLTEFNALHRFFFRDTLSLIRIEGAELDKIRQAAADGPVLYMMRNWGQIEYNFFNTLFLKEKLPLAEHANLIRMHWWMPFKKLTRKWIARLNYFYEKGIFPENASPDPLFSAVAEGKTTFAFLNLPDLLGKEEPDPDDVIFSLLKAVDAHPEGKPLTLIPLTLLYDRRPGKAKKSIVDILFGERENPGKLRKLVLFFRNHKKKAAAQVGDPVDLLSLAEAKSDRPLAERAAHLRLKLHQIFYKEQQVITGPRLKSRTRMIEVVMQDKGLRDALKVLASEQKKPIDQLYLEAEKNLEGIVSDPNYTVLDLWSILLTWVFKNLYDGLTVDEEGLSRVRQIARQSPLILVPSHRSHVDYLLLSYIFYQQRLSMPLVAAGDNLSFWPAGPVFRKSGAYFMRRSFGSDKLYALLFKTYVKTLVQEGYFQEFFIEGTRSRTGKFERPRTGLLSIYLDCFLEGASEELYFVPISFNYEKVLEEKSYVQEVKGATKEKEKVSDLFKLGRHLKHRSGQVYVNFAEPLSLKEFVQEMGLKEDDSEENKHRAAQVFAHRIARAIEGVTIVTAPALIASGLLSHPRRGQTISLLFEKVEIFRKALKLKGVRFSDALEKNYPKAIQGALARYKAQGLVQEHHDGVETFYIVEGSPRLQLNYYKNSILDKIIHLCIASLAFERSPSRPCPQEELALQHAFLKDLLSREFLHIPDLAEALADLASLGAVEEVRPGVWDVKSKKTLDAFGRLIQNFLESYELVLTALKRMTFHKLQQKALVQRILELGQKLLLKGDLSLPESLSRFSALNALEAFREKGLVLNHEKDLGKNGLQIYSSCGKKEEFERMLSLLRGSTSPAEKSHPPLYLLQK